MMVESFDIIGSLVCEMRKADALCSLETKFTDPKFLYVCNLFIIKKCRIS